MSLFSNPTTYSVIAAFLSAIAAWGSLRTAKKNLFNQNIQTHRSNLKNLADACNDHFSYIEKDINNPQAIKHFYYTFYQALDGLQSLEDDKETIDSLRKYFYINLKHNVHEEIKNSRALGTLINSGILSEIEGSRFKMFILKTNRYYESIKIK